jgi:hypothetical protein
MAVIFWSGQGYLVAVFAFGSALIANLISDFASGSEEYWNHHKWPLAIALFVSAAACRMFGRIFREPDVQVLIDPKTRKELVRRTPHTLFFIPIIWWAPILAVGGVIALGTEFFK